MIILDPDNLFGSPVHLSHKYPTGKEFDVPWTEKTRWNHPVAKVRAKHIPEKRKVIEPELKKQIIKLDRPKQEISNYQTFLWDPKQSRTSQKQFRDLYVKSKK